MNQDYITLTPVNLKKDDKKRHDYNYEKGFFEKGTENPRWTDSIHNTSTIGNLFGFVIDRKTIEIFEIIDIQEKDKSREHWNEDTRKKVLMLSKMKLIDSWRKYKKRTGTFGDKGFLRGTTRLKWIPPKFKDVY